MRIVLAAFVAGLVASAVLALPGSAAPTADCTFTGQPYPSVGVERAGHHYIISFKRGLLCNEAVFVARNAGRKRNPGPFRPFKSGIWACMSMVSREYPTVAVGQCVKPGASVFVNWSVYCPPGQNCKKLDRRP